jgi:hypothetical protein
MAQRIGTTKDELEKFQYALSQSGVGSENLVRVFGSFDQAMQKTAQSGGDASTALGRLGIAVTTADGALRDPIDTLKDLADAFQKMPDGAAKTAAAIEDLGKRFGPQLIPLLNQGKAGIEALGLEAEKLGLTFSDAESKAALAVVLSQGQMSSAFDALTEHIGLAFGPAATSLFSGFTEAIVAIGPALQKLADALGSGLLSAFQGLGAAIRGPAQ